MRENRAVVTPTVSERIHALDVLRGFAILGILVANLPGFSGPDLSSTGPITGEVLRGSDAWVQVLTVAFVTGKFRSTLAVLFGVGLYLQFAKRSVIAGNWPGGYLKRTAWLMLFGVAHGLLIWYGDILFSYALTALVCCFLVGIPDKARQVLTIVMIALSAVGGLFLTGLVWLASLFTAFGGDFDGRADRLADIHAYAFGSYWDQFLHRLNVFGIQLLGLVVLLPVLATLFLIGIHLGKAGFIAAPSRHPRMRALLLWLGWGIGLPLNMAALLFWRTGTPLIYTTLIEMVGGPLLGMGYLTLVAIAAEAGFMKPVGRALAAVGRVALSCYIMQSLICTALFYDWGLGLFNRTSSVQDLAVACGVAVANVAFAMLWLRWFALGPLEWAWRSLTEGKRLPLRRAGYVVAPSPKLPDFDWAVAGVGDEASHRDQS